MFDLDEILNNLAPILLFVAFVVIAILRRIQEAWSRKGQTPPAVERRPPQDLQELAETLFRKLTDQPQGGPPPPVVMGDRPPMAQPRQGQPVPPHQVPPQQRHMQPRVAQPRQAPLPPYVAEQKVEGRQRQQELARRQAADVEKTFRAKEETTQQAAPKQVVIQQAQRPRQAPDPRRLAPDPRRMAQDPRRQAQQRPAQAPPPAQAPQQAQRRAKQPPKPTQPRRPAAATARLFGDLHAVKRAMVLHEILGPPRAMRDLDDLGLRFD